LLERRRPGAAGRDPGRCAVAERSDARLHFRGALCARRRALPSKLSAARTEGGRPLGGLLGSGPTAGGIPMTMPPTVVLEVRGLKKHFPVRRGLFGRQVGTVYAVDGVSFALNSGETLGLVGESGCGKSTAGKMILKLIEPTAGQIYLNG